MDRNFTIYRGYLKLDYPKITNKLPYSNSEFSLIMFNLLVAKMYVYSILGRVTCALWENLFLTLFHNMNKMST